MSLLPTFDRFAVALLPNRAGRHAAIAIIEFDAAHYISSFRTYGTVKIISGHLLPTFDRYATVAGDGF